MPSNANSAAGYSFTFQPSIAIPSQSIIKVTFDPAYLSLYSLDLKSVMAYLSGSLTRVAFLSISGKTLSVTTGEDSDPLLPITLSYYGLVLHSTPATMSFSLQIQYKGSLLAQASSFQITLSPAVSLSGVASLHYFPRN